VTSRVAGWNKRIAACCVLFAALSGGVAAGVKQPMKAEPMSAALDQIVERERAFSKLAGEAGIKAAFLEFIADDGVIFTPVPIVGRASLASGPDGQGILSWTPAFAGMSRSMDLGFTTGPYAWKDATVVQTGQYLTIWRRQPNGEWRFVLDRGTPGPADTNVTAQKVSKLRAAGGQPSDSDPSNARSQLLATERALSVAAQRSAVAGLVERLACNARIVREGMEPAITPAQHAKLLMNGPAAIRYHLLDSGTSAAGDLAYTYGEASWMDGDRSRQGYFVRLWQRHGKRWQIIFDSSSAIPPRPRKS
jgi:ketosteroid isomerase-like protein